MAVLADRRLQTFVVTRWGGDSWLLRVPALVSVRAHLGQRRSWPATALGVLIAARVGATVAQAVEHPTGCAYASLTVGGRRGPALDDSPSVVAELRRLPAVPAVLP